MIVVRWDATIVSGFVIKMSQGLLDYHCDVRLEQMGPCVRRIAPERQPPDMAEPERPLEGGNNARRLLQVRADDAAASSTDLADNFLFSGAPRKTWRAIFSAVSRVSSRSDGRSNLVAPRLPLPVLPTLTVTFGAMFSTMATTACPASWTTTRHSVSGEID